MNRASAIANIITAAALLAITAGLLAWWLNTATEPKGMDDLGLPPCMTEDQVAPNCYWDATERSNGEGHSFIVMNGTVTFDDGTTEPAED